MFYLKDWLDNPDENKKFSDKHGYKLKVPDTWEELDAMMAFFHRPDQDQFGGALYRTQFFIGLGMVVRFHAKGYYPFDDNMKPQINNEAGVKALEELIAASKFLYPGARSNGLFENFEAFGQGDKFCNIGWGGTQKFLNSDKSKVKGKLAFGPMPGGMVKGQLLKTPYFNWGWNYVVSSASKQPELAYLFTLYACSPAMSTIAVRDIDGYFDPFREVHYKDPQIIQNYSAPFLAVHEEAMRDSIPDLLSARSGRIFRRAARQCAGGRRRRKEAEGGSRRSGQQMGHHHAADGQAEPSRAVALPQEQLPRGHPEPARLTPTTGPSARLWFAFTDDFSRWWNRRGARQACDS